VYVVSKNETNPPLNWETVSAPVNEIVLLYSFLSRTVPRFNCARFAMSVNLHSVLSV
jgi:hypothetical protein